MPACARCGEENPARARFCLACGSPLPIASPHETRRTVTVLFADLAGSTALAEQLDPETVRRVISRYFDEMRSVLEHHGATIEKFIGDAIMAAFGIPAIHEDDGLRAMRAAVDMRRQLDKLNVELTREWGVQLHMRIGINTGEVLAGDASSAQSFVSGDAVNIAARLEQSAGSDEILISQATRELGMGRILCEALNPLAVKGKAQPLIAWRLIAIDGDARARGTSIRSPFVGRDAELRQLDSALQECVATRTCMLVTVAGPPGIGKSRLVEEFAAQADARVVAGRCLPYGQGITYWPLVEIINELCGDDIDAAALRLLGDDGRTVATQLNAVVGAAMGSVSPVEIAWAVRRLFEGTATRQPLVVCIDDIHWAEPTLLELLEYLHGFVSAAPLLLLCSTRSELFEQRPSWAVPRRHALVLRLEAISPDAAAGIIEVMGEPTLDSSARERIAATAEGNPLFIEQLLALNADVSRTDGMRVPATIHGLLAARIDLLSSDERAILERASVEGRSFHRGALAQMLDEPLRHAASTHLLSLMRKELIEPDTPLFAGDDAFRFGHILIRDAAYQGIPKQLRAE